MKNPNNKIFDYVLNGIILVLFFLISYSIYSYFVNLKNSNIPGKDILTDTTKKQFNGNDSKKITVEIKNGTGERKIAVEVRDYLIKKGFDVINTDNFETDNVEKTIIVDRVKDKERALKVAEALELGNSRIQQVENSKLYTDVSVILGKDYSELDFFKKISK